RSNVHVVVDGWLAALVLLQDDEACVREAIRATVAPLVTSVHAAPSDMMVLPYAVAYLAQTFGHVDRLQEAVGSYLTTYTALFPRLDECISASDGHAYNVLCDKIFEAESGNYFKEPELLVQLFAQHFVHTGKVRLPTLLSDLEACLVRWAAASALHQQAWVGGTTFFPDVFPLFHNAVVVAIAQVHATNEAHGALQAIAHKVLGTETHNMHPLLCQALTALAAGDDSLAPLLFLTPSWASKHQIVAE
ncbi:hypothetical protein SPRG_18039, partial [Saprolegnia parasitica CBS 223.65]